MNSNIKDYQLQTDNFSLLKSILFPRRSTWEEFNKKNKQIRKEDDKLNLLQMAKQAKHQRFKELFRQKLDQVNIYNKPTIFQIKDPRNNFIQERRKGLKVKDWLISILFAITLVFDMVVFLISGWISFISKFEAEIKDSPVIMALLIIAAIVNGIKVVIDSSRQRIQGGVNYAYLSKILGRYLFTFSFLIDVSHIAVTIACVASNAQYISIGIVLFILSILKVFTIVQQMRIFQIAVMTTQRRQQYWRLVKVVMFNIVFGHLIASFLLAMSKLDSQNNWMIPKSIDTEDWFVQYIWAYYWACTIILTVGFGDISAFTFREAIIVSFLQLFSCIILAYNISQIGSIISSIRSSQHQYRTKVAIFKRMAKQDEVSSNIQRKIQAYLKAQNQIGKIFQHERRMNLFSTIPEQLRNEYYIEANKNLYFQLPFFRNLHRQTLLKLNQRFESKIYYPESPIYKLDNHSNQIMILKSGIVGLIYQKHMSFLNGYVIQKIKNVQSQIIFQNNTKLTPTILKSGFLNQKQINYDIYSLNYAFIYRISYQHFLESIRMNQFDFYEFFSLKHKHRIDNSQFQHVRCDYCSQEKIMSIQEPETIFKNLFSEDFINLEYKPQTRLKYLKLRERNIFHTKFQCPKLHYIPLKKIIIAKHNGYSSNVQKGQKSEDRKKDKSKNCLLLRKGYVLPEQQLSIISSKSKSKTKLKMAKFNNESDDNKYRINKDQNAGFTNLQQLLIQKFALLQKMHKQNMQKMINQINQIPQKQSEEGLWDLQIDAMHNFTNYFSNCNSQLLYQINLKNRRFKKNKVTYKRPSKQIKILKNLKKGFSSQRLINLNI